MHQVMQAAVLPRIHKASFLCFHFISFPSVSKHRASAETVLTLLHTVISFELGVAFIRHDIDRSILNATTRIPLYSASHDK